MTGLTLWFLLSKQWSCLQRFSIALSVCENAAIFYQRLIYRLMSDYKGIFTVGGGRWNSIVTQDCDLEQTTTQNTSLEVISITSVSCS